MNKEPPEPPRVPGLEHLSMERESDHDLWSGIEPRLAPRRRTLHAFAGWRAAASLLAGVTAIIGIAVVQQPLAPRPDFSPEVVAAAPARSSGAQAIAMRTLVKANLKIVTDGEKQLRHAIAAHPGADYLRQLLASNREQQRELRERLTQTS